MGIIDDVKWLMTCPRCNAVEAVRAVDRGSAYGGSLWGPLDKPKLFDATIEGGIREMPNVKRALCKSCS